MLTQQKQTVCSGETDYNDSINAVSCVSVMKVLAFPCKHTESLSLFGFIISVQTRKLTPFRELVNG